jgi:hypothetical protein
MTRVTEIRWRYTAIETRNWETVIVPNSQMVKNQALVLGAVRDSPSFGGAASTSTSTSAIRLRT